MKLKKQNLEMKSDDGDSRRSEYRQLLARLILKDITNADAAKILGLMQELQADCRMG